MPKYENYHVQYSTNKYHSPGYYLYGERDETDAEMTKRQTRERIAQKEREDWERSELERLKAKFESK